MDEPKHTKEAVSVMIISDNRFLLLWRYKWESEGTPFILPGGGLKEGESILEAAQRELMEEISWTIPYDMLNSVEIIESGPTKWTGKMNYVVLKLIKDQDIEIEIENKFAGAVWVPLSYNIMKNLRPLLMPGALRLLCDKWPELFTGIKQ